MNYFSVWRAERRFVQRVRQKINQDLTKVVPVKHVFTLFFSRKHRRERTRYWGDESPEGFFFFFLTCLSERLCGDILHKGACFWQTVHSFSLEFWKQFVLPSCEVSAELAPEVETRACKATLKVSRVIYCRFTTQACTMKCQGRHGNFTHECQLSSYGECVSVSEKKKKSFSKSLKEQCRVWENTPDDVGDVGSGMETFRQNMCKKTGVWSIKDSSV